MILIIDNLINTFIGINSCLFILSLNKINITNFYILLIFDLLLNKIPIISFIIIIPRK